ncbi:DUF6233 domain-containing protein [Streptomyces sp. NPDC048002]|uniref:DUF6233 domain-containing protein n=1 Tax=Streptomyces sp. NPDC048002 TaxID=3154344 RepID=UPI003411BB7D
MGGPHRRQDRGLPPAAGPEEEHGNRDSRPTPPDWIVEPGIGSSQSPIEVAAGECHIAEKRQEAVSRAEALRLLATGLRACTHCQPNTELGILVKKPPHRSNLVTPCQP